jgi:HAD superfamily hydrolase (TIGR01549 family)
MKIYDTVIFDLFDTIVNFNFNRLPSIELQGVKSRTTSREVYSVFKKYYPDIGFSEFYLFFIESYRQFQEMKLVEYREYPNRERFILMLRNMNLASDGKTGDKAEEMAAAHMEGLASAVEFPEENVKALECVKDKGYRMAIISNFDYARAAYALIDRFRIRHFFEKIIISEEVGWRKPNPIIFLRAFELLGIGPEEALMVGDNFKADIAGAKGVGMDAVWLENTSHTPYENCPETDFIIKKLPEISEILPERGNKSR